jgi:transposase
MSPNTRQLIVTLLQNGKSCHQVAAQLYVSYSMVQRVYTSIKDSLPQHLGGCPRKLTTCDQRLLARKVTSGVADTAPQLKKLLDLDVSTQTVRNALKKAGLKSAVKQKKPFLSKAHQRRRLEFALRHQHWTLEDWSRVVWSDESKINRLGSDGRSWVWKKPGSALKEQHVSGTVKFGGGSLMVWGCMTPQGVGHICKIDGRMDAEQYTNILQANFLRTVEDYGLDKANLIFQQDNDPKHTSKKASKWFKQNKVNVLKWPAQSPDLNPIEHLWQHLKWQLNAYEVPPAGILELWGRVEVEWKSIPKEVCRNLIESMPRRIEAVIKAKGGQTKY